MLFIGIFAVSFALSSIPRRAIKRRILLDGWGPVLRENFIMSLVIAIMVYFALTMEAI